MDVTELPGTAPQALARIWGDLIPLEREAILPHLLGETSAEWLAFLLTRHGYQVSASTIRSYRRSLKT